MVAGGSEKREEPWRETRAVKDLQLVVDGWREEWTGVGRSGKVRCFV